MACSIPYAFPSVHLNPLPLVIDSVLSFCVFVVVGGWDIDWGIVTRVASELDDRKGIKNSPRQTPGTTLS